jgi:hypothetical protein
MRSEISRAYCPHILSRFIFLALLKCSLQNCEALMNTTREDAVKLDRLLRRTEAAKYVTETYGLPCSPKTLAKIACVSSDGPPFRKAGRFPLYPTSGLDAWAQNKIGPLVRSTAEVSRRVV